MDQMNTKAQDFIQACYRTNEALAAITEKEEVSEETAILAAVIAKNMKVKEIGDCLLYAAALNVLNTYVKKSRENTEQVGYWFKESSQVLLDYIKKHPDDKMITAHIVEEKGGLNVCRITINKIQTSFHCVILQKGMERFILDISEEEKEKLWDGIRKQFCSMTLFNFAMNNSYGRTYQMEDGSDFMESFEKARQMYRSGKLSFIDVRKRIFGKPELTEEEKQAEKFIRDVKQYVKKEDWTKDKSPVLQYLPKFSEEYSDFGNGRNYLFRLFEIADNGSGIWFPEFYRIELFHTPEELKEEEGIAAVTIPKEYHYDFMKGCFNKEGADWNKLQKLLSQGKRGIRIYCEDLASGVFLRRFVYEWKASIKKFLKDAYEEAERR